MHDSSEGMIDLMDVPGFFFFFKEILSTCGFTNVDFFNIGNVEILGWKYPFHLFKIFF